MGSDIDRTHASFLLRLRDRTDQLSWPQFHERYGHMLYRYARYRGASAVDAEDVVQEVEMQLFQAIDGFEYDARRGRFRAYLHTAVIHALARRASKQAGQPLKLDPREFDHLAAQREADTDAEWEVEWQLNRLRQAVQAIAGEFEPHVLKAFEMHVLAGRPVVDTAEHLGVSKWTVYRAKSRVLGRVRDKLAELDPDEDI